MKKISLILLLLTGSLISIAQSLDEINELMGKFEYKKAKEGIDKYLGDPKNAAKSDGWYFKGRIYNALSKDSLVSIEDAMNYKLGAFNAFKKYQELDAKDIRFILENHISYFDLYNGFFDIGAKAFNGNNYETAFNGFKNAALVEDYIRLKGYETNGFKFSSLDTSLVLNTAIAARNAKKDDDAAIYYKQLADANLTAGNYLDVYEWLAEYYAKKKDKASFDAILEKGRKFYPKDEYWAELDIRESTEGLNKPDMFKKYDELMAKYPDNYVLHYNYSVELYHYIYSEEMKNANTSAYKTKLPELLKKVIAIKSTSEANFLMMLFLYNNSIDLSEDARKLKGPKAEDLKKKRALEAEAAKEMNESIPYAETVVNLFPGIQKPKSSEKINYKQALNILKTIYDLKKDAAKSALYDKKIKEIQ